MNDNVIIFGAGSSYDAGIPLSLGFVDKIMEFAYKGKSEGGKLSDQDKIIFDEAMKVMSNLYNYHGSANFDDRNIEDILSILSFNIIGKTPKEKDSLNWMTKAIASTIELTCNVKHNGSLDEPQINGNQIYRLFWNSIIERFKDSLNIPTIVTFNYDLVLERALFQILINETPVPDLFDGIILKYYYKPPLDRLCYKIKKKVYYRVNASPTTGTELEICPEEDLKTPMVVEILKLHGSLNFPEKMRGMNQVNRPPTNVVDNPFIIPPISNKSISNDAETIWKVALQRLRETKNIVVVGYSMPRTDIYVQYFLKTALGPKFDLNKIIVFNPDLYSHTDAKAEMIDRYNKCFSRQVMDRLITLNPPLIGQNPAYFNSYGKFEHFVNEIKFASNGLFY